MKLLAGIAIILTSLCFLSACETTRTAPDIQSVQPTQHQQNQAKLQAALQS